MLPLGKKPEQLDLYAAQKIIADISSGLYRSPAAAIKELVTNAYDADAENVVIETDVPRFRTLVIRDDGNGMTIKHFKEVVSHIGGSRKRIIGGETTQKKGRKLIGRIGIGMLAVAQLGFKYYVSSSVKGDPTRFIAEVDLEPFHKDDAALISMGRMKTDSDEVFIGAVKYVDNIPEDIDAHYTVITVPQARKGLISEMTSAVREAVGAKEALSAKEPLINSFEKLIEVTRSSKRADTSLDGYYYMLWELGHLCPVDYADTGPFDTSQRAIEGVENIEPPRIKDFRVVVDGIEIRRPQMFPSRCTYNYNGPVPKLYPLRFEREVAGRLLKFYGYILAQQPRIDPEGFLGVHIRIRNVGIGKYDRTWLGYPFDEGIKFGQLSGEVFVEEGLEQALNIDRDSFKETDVHYQALRAYLWEKLRKEIFPEFKLRQSRHSSKKRAAAQSVQSTRLNERLEQLPAPLIIEKEEISIVVTPTVSNWIETDQDILRLDKVKWRELIDDTGMSSREAQERFIRVLRVLLSSELLAYSSEEDIEPLLRAIAVAVQ